MVCVTKWWVKDGVRASPVPQVPHLPRKVTVDVSATPATQNDGRCHQVPRLPRQQPRRQRTATAAQARHRSQSSAISATPATQSDGRCLQVPRLPRKVTVTSTKCHACQAKAWHASSGRRQRAATAAQARHQSQPSAISAHLQGERPSATATQSDGV